MSTTRRRWGNAGQRLTPRPAIDGIRRALVALRPTTTGDSDA